MTARRDPATGWVPRADGGLTFGDPRALIAQAPLADRAASRLLLLERATARWQHRRFADVTTLVQPGDCLILNDTRVIPARLLGRRLPPTEAGPRPAGGAAELLRLHPGPSPETWWCLARPARRLVPGVHVSFNHGSLVGHVVAQGDGAQRLVRFEATGDLAAQLEAVGDVPLPPYIRRRPTPADRARYQTVYAQHEGAVAAPTAGLHFTQAVLDALRHRGVTVASLTLHVGAGTFAPVSPSAIASRRLPAEWFTLPATTAEAINATTGRGGRIIAVGTTTCRVLETCAAVIGGLTVVTPQAGWTTLFLRPPDPFRVVDQLITNFHLPGTSPLCLVEAFAGGALLQRAYRAAMAARYRWASYGDAMLIR